LLRCGIGVAYLTNLVDHLVDTPDPHSAFSAICALANRLLRKSVSFLQHLTFTSPRRSRTIALRVEARPPGAPLIRSSSPSITAGWQGRAMSFFPVAN